MSTDENPQGAGDGVSEEHTGDGVTEEAIILGMIAVELAVCEEDNRSEVERLMDAAARTGGSLRISVGADADSCPVQPCSRSCDSKECPPPLPPKGGGGIYSGGSGHAESFFDNPLWRALGWLMPLLLVLLALAATLAASTWMANNWFDDNEPVEVESVVADEPLPEDTPTAACDLRVEAGDEVSYLAVCGGGAIANLFEGVREAPPCIKGVSPRDGDKFDKPLQSFCG